MSTQITYRGEQELSVGGLILTVVFEVDADITYEAARLGGPPEKCSPGYSELDITEKRIIELKDEDGDAVSFLPEASGRLLAALNWEQVEEKIWEEFHSGDKDSDDGDWLGPEDE